MEYQSSRLIKVFIAAPGDVKKDKDELKQKIEGHINHIAQLIAPDYTFSVRIWEDIPQQSGRPQQGINPYLRECELYIFIFGKRWGSNSGIAPSGTEEEYRIACHECSNNAEKEMYIFFKNISPEERANADEQLSKVLKFREQLDNERSHISKPYDDINDLKEKVEKELLSWLKENQPLQEYQQEFGEENDDDDIYERSLSNSSLKKYRLSKDDKIAAAKAKTNKIFQDAIKYYEKGNVIPAMRNIKAVYNIVKDVSLIPLYAQMLFENNQVEEAREELKKALEISRVNENEDTAHLYYYLAKVEKSFGYLDYALELYKKALTIYEKINNVIGIISCNLKISSLYNFNRNVEESLIYIKAAQKTYDESLGRDNKRKEFYCDLLMAWGRYYIAKEGPKSSTTLECLNKAISISREYKAKKEEAKINILLGNAYLAANLRNKAEEAYRNSLDYYISVSKKGNVTGAAIAKCKLGMLYLFSKDKDYSKAEAELKEALDISERGKKSEGIYLCNYYLGEVYFAQTRERGCDYRTLLSLSLSHYKKASEVACKASNMYRQSNSYYKMGMIYEKLDDLEGAIKQYNISDQLNMEMGAKARQAMSSYILGRLYKSNNSTLKAKEKYSKAVEINRTLKPNSNRVLAACLVELASLYDEKDDYEILAKIYLEVLQIDKKLKNIREIAFTYYNLGELELKNKNYPSARKNFNNCLAILEDEIIDGGLSLEAKCHYRIGCSNLLEDAQDLTCCFANFNHAYELYDQIIASEVKLKTISQDDLNYYRQMLICTEYILAFLCSKLSDTGNLLRFRELYNVNIERRELKGEYGIIVHSSVEMGLIFEELKQYSIAVELYNKALEQQNNINLPNRFAICYSSVANIYKSLSKSVCDEYFEKAILMLNAAIEINREYNNTMGVCHESTTLGHMYLAQDSFESIDKAINLFKNVLEMEKSISDKSKLALCYIDLGKAYLKREVINECIINFKRALDINLEAKEDKKISQVYTLLGEAYKKNQEFELAGNMYRASAFLDKQKQNNIEGAAIGYFDAYRCYKSANLLDSAMNCLKRCIVLNKHSENCNSKLNLKNLLWLYWGKANNVKYNNNDIYLIIDYLEKAYDLAATLGLQKERAIISHAIGDKYNKLKKFYEAKQYFNLSLQANMEIRPDNSNNIIIKIKDKISVCESEISKLAG